MLAIFKTGGKQYSARAGQILKVEKLEGSKGDKVSITDVLAISDQSTNSLGEPLLKDASIEAKIVDQIRDKKIIVFKKRRRQNSRKRYGHRQPLSKIQITKILSKNGKIVSEMKKEAIKTSNQQKDDKKTVSKKEKIIKKTVFIKR